MTIRRPARELYEFWRQPRNLTAVLKHPFQIDAVSDRESRWKTRVAGHDVVWNAVIIEDKPGQLIAWETQAPSDLSSAGSIRFEAAPGDYGTEVKVQLKYQPPGGKLTAFFAKLTGKEPAHETVETLRRFKALMEAGEIPTTEGQSAGEPQASKPKA